MTRALGIGVAALFVMMVTGCPPGNNNGGGQDTTGATDLVGVWRGQVESSRTESLNGGDPGNPSTSTTTIEIEFDAEGFPTSIRIFGYSNTPDNQADLARSGDEDTIESQAGNVNVTQELRVRSANYTADSVQLEIDITHTGTGGSLTLDGTGTQSMTLTLNADGELEFEATAEYNVEQSISTATFDTSSEETATGTLTRS